MKTYNKPVVLMNEELAEGVYAASGCYTGEAWVNQTPREGFPYYVVCLKLWHEADHHSNGQIVTIKFNKAVSYAYCNDSNATVLGDGTDTLVVSYNYHANQKEEHGLGDIYLNAATTDSGLEVIGVSSVDCDLGAGDHYGHTW